MAATIHLAASALAGLEDIRTWYADQGAPEDGARLVARIIERIEALADHPDLGRVVPEFDQPFLRELIHRPFRIVYRRDDSALRIVRVWRGERLLRLSGDRAGWGRSRGDLRLTVQFGELKSAHVQDGPPNRGTEPPRSDLDPRIGDSTTVSARQPAGRANDCGHRWDTRWLPVRWSGVCPAELHSQRAPENGPCKYRTSALGCDLATLGTIRKGE